MDLRGSLDEILKMGSEQEVSQEDKFAVVLILHVDDTPAVLASSNLLAVNDDRLLGTDNSKGNKTL